MLNIYRIPGVEVDEIVQTLEVKPGRWICRVLAFIVEGIPPHDDPGTYPFDDQNGDRLYEAYSTEAAALRVFQLHAESSALYADLQAYGAPTECGRPGFKKIEQELIHLDSDFYVETLALPLN